MKRLAEAKRSRNGADVVDSLRNLKAAAAKDENLMPLVLNAVQAKATEGEVMASLQDVYGEYIDPGVF